MDITISVGSWSEFRHKVIQARNTLFIDDTQSNRNNLSHHNTQSETKSSNQFSHDENDIHQHTQHLILEIDEQVKASARVLSSGVVDQVFFSSELREEVKTRFFTRVIREAIVKNFDHTIHINLQNFREFTNKIPTYIQSLQLPVEDLVYTLPSDADVQKTLFDNSVVRLSGEQDFMQHLMLMCHFGYRSLDIFSNDLRGNRFNSDIANTISRLARRHRNVRIRVLVQSTQLLIGSTHPIVSLAQRLPSSVAIRKLKNEAERPDHAYAIIDKSMLLYYNDEREATGFANYEAKAESEHFTEGFDRMWDYYSEVDPNLLQLNL